MNVRAGPSWSWMSTPTNWTSPRWALETEASSGASCRQGPHHDAQMFTTTGLPRSCVSSDWNAAGSSRGSAVGLEGRSEPEGPSPVSLGEPPQAEASSARAATIIATTDRTILVRFIRLLLSNEDCRFEADAILRPKVPFYLRF